MAKKKAKKTIRKRLYFCPKCFLYSVRSERECPKCGCKKGMMSVLREGPVELEQIPYEDLVRVVEYRKVNGFSYEKYEKLLKSAPRLGVRIPRDEKPLYGLKKPRNQTGGYGGIANHAGISGHVHSVPGGGVSPR